MMLSAQIYWHLSELLTTCLGSHIYRWVSERFTQGQFRLQILRLIRCALASSTFNKNDATALRRSSQDRNNVPIWLKVCYADQDIYDLHLTLPQSIIRTARILETHQSLLSAKLPEFVAGLHDDIITLVDLWEQQLILGLIESPDYLVDIRIIIVWMVLLLLVIIDC